MRSEELLNNFKEAREKLNNYISDSTSQEIIAFKEISLYEPNFISAIHGFYTSVSWLYVHYYETGKFAVRFLIDNTKKIDSLKYEYCTNHVNLIHSFRTFLQHNLNLKNPNDLIKKDNCLIWIENQITTPWPSDEKQWETLLRKLYNETTETLNILHMTCLNESQNPNFFKVWKNRLERHVEPFEYDELVEIIAKDIGLDNIDPVKVREKNYDKWNDKLKILKDLKRKNEYMRSMLEATLINVDNLPLPINGKDIMEQFNLNPGHEVGKKLKMAREIYTNEPCSKSTLLEKLKKV